MALVMAVACQKEPLSSDFDGEFLVYTAHSEDADFSAYDTFTIADSLLAIDGNDGYLFLNDWAKTVKSQYIKDMQDMGYTYVDTGKVDSDLDQDVAGNPEADLAIQISYVISTSYFTSFVPSTPYWWMSYPGYWYPGYWGDWGYWGYSFPVSYSYSTHSLLTEIVDLTAVTGDDKPLPVLWNSFIDGNISNNREDSARFSRAIDQSFAQSEYLDRTK